MIDNDKTFLLFGGLSIIIGLLVMYRAKKNGVDIKNRFYQMKLVVYCSPIWAWVLILEKKSYVFTLALVIIVISVAVINYGFWKIIDRIAYKINGRLDR